jgi:hypothetical protein
MPVLNSANENMHLIGVQWMTAAEYRTDSVADPDPGSGAFLTPGSGIRNRFFPDPGSQSNIFESLLKIFWVKIQ